MAPTVVTYTVDNPPGTFELELLPTNDPPEDVGGTILYIRVDPENDDIVQLCIRFESGLTSVITDDQGEP